MTDLTVNTLWARAFTEELVRAGVTDVCLAPGSRSTPLVLAAVESGRLKLRVFLDERSAAFFAVGLGKVTGRPAAVVTTSGTAVANLLPAVVEASHSDTPLLLLTADRPHRLRDADANQAIDQIGIFGTYVREFFEVAPPAVDGPALRHLRVVASRAVAAAMGVPAGPVHLNFPFDKPLEPVPGARDVPVDFPEDHPRAFRGRASGAPYVWVTPRWPLARDEELGVVAGLVDSAERGVIVAGPTSDPARLGPAVLRLAAASSFPVLADPLSGARYLPPGDAPVVAAYDLMLRAPEASERLVPDVILRVGQSPTSAALIRWLEESTTASQVVVDAGRRWKDHLAAATHYLQADPVNAMERLAVRVHRREPGAWTELWKQLDERTKRASAEQCEETFFEGSVLAEVVASLPTGATLFVSNSMPVRDLDAFGTRRADTMHVYANRGASGIDGIVSTALGVSAAGARPTVCVLGDLAFLHDANGLLATREGDAAVVFIVIHNDGGGIFHHLPIRDFEPAFTPYFATPHGLDLVHLANLYRLPHVRVQSRGALGKALTDALALGGSHIIEVPSDREENRRLRAAAEAAVRTSLQEITLEKAGT